MWGMIAKDAFWKVFISFVIVCFTIIGLGYLDCFENDSKCSIECVFKYDWVHLTAKYYMFIVLVFVVSFIINVIIDYVEYKKSAMLHMLNFNSMSTNKTLVHITENISHELSTPLEVISFKMFKIRKIINTIINDEFSIWMKENCTQTNSCTKEEKCLLSDSNIEILKQHFLKSKNKKKYIDELLKIDNEFKYVDASIEQIGNILQKMKGFKSIKYSNGNKTLYDIIETSFQVMAISHKDFKWGIDEKFKKYRLCHKKCLHNGDLLNIMINHIKNSIEANATTISAHFIRYTNGFLYLYIKDNGSGIPRQFINTVFSPNISSKSKMLDIRGNGMFINREIIRSTGGDIRIVETSKRGTVFELKIRAEKI